MAIDTVTIELTARALFVREGATGSGSLGDPRGDLDGAMEDALPGDTVFVLFSPDPLVLASPLTVPAGISLVGEASGLSNGATVIVPPGPRPEIRGQLLLESDTKAAGFLSTASSGSPNLNLDGADTVTVDNLQVVNGADQITFFETTGTVAIRNSQFSTGTALDGGLTSGSLTLLVEGNVFGESSLFLNVDGHVDLSIQDNAFANTAQVRIDQLTGGTASSDIDGNTFVAANGIRLDDEGGGGQLSITNNTFDQNNDFAFNLGLRGGPYDAVIVGNMVNSTVAILNQDLLITAQEGGTGRVRVDSNVTARGMRLRLLPGGSLQAGNDVGLAGVGGNLEVKNTGPATMNVESLATLDTENTTATPVVVLGTVNDVPLGTCDFP
ncbi:MAG: hypothetical protein HY319_21445 [Armatimonadetes bacterium]|nr:hypothetical protein [Armatimonadota bacterium]